MGCSAKIFIYNNGGYLTIKQTQQLGFNNRIMGSNFKTGLSFPNYKDIAKNVINLEIKALTKLKRSLNKNFDKAVNAIVNCQSKIILCGVGKSGIIANKISATLSSIGTPSFSLSANDCSHGDMGSITKKDILILISYSGNSIELKNIINYANRNKVLLIGITSKKNSDLYKNSDIKLITPEVKEAGLDIVPTSSTINQLSLGDALAISTLKKKKLMIKILKSIIPLEVLVKN